jgi:GNAT superfamily N-acetyltransferase
MIRRTRNYELPNGETIYTHRLDFSIGLENIIPALELVNSLRNEDIQLDLPDVTMVGRHGIWAAFRDASMDYKRIVGFMQAGPEVRGRPSLARTKAALNPLTAIYPTFGAYTAIDWSTVVPKYEYKGVGTALAHTVLQETPRYNAAEVRVMADNTPYHQWAESVGFVAVGEVETVPVLGETDATVDIVRYRTPTDAAMTTFNMETTHPWLTEQAAAKARHPASQ